MKMTPEEIEQVTKEIADFEAKSLQYASSSPLLSAHYHRLYTACKGSLKTFDRVARTLKDKAYREKRKQAREGKAAAAGKSSGTGQKAS
jgi:hypothetical protein